MFPVATAHVIAFLEHPWAYVYFRTLRCPFLAAAVHFCAFSRASVGPRLLKDLEVPIFGTTRARLFIPEVPVAPRPLEDLEVPVLGSFGARHFVPMLPVGPRPLQDREVPAACRERAEHARKHFSRVTLEERTISARARFAAMSAPHVRVTFPAGRAFFPAAGATSAPAAAQRRQTRRNHRR